MSDNGHVTGQPSAPDPATALSPRLPSPLQEVTDERFARHGVRLLLKRDDLIHPQLVGNKWRKLVPNLRAAAGQAAAHLRRRLLEPPARHRRRG